MSLRFQTFSYCELRREWGTTANYVYAYAQLFQNAGEQLMQENRIYDGEKN